MVMAVEPWMASMRPSWQLEREQWSNHTWLEAKMEMPSPPGVPWGVAYVSVAPGLAVVDVDAVDDDFDDEMQALLLLSSLLESWETLVVSLSNSMPNGKLTTSMVMDVLFNEEAQRREMGSTNQSESQALVSEGSRKRGRGQVRGHHRGIEKGRWRSQERGRTVRDREVFSTYAPCKGHIWMANNTSNRVVGRGVVGRGSVRFCMTDGRSMTLTEVRHVPNLRKNLISIRILDSKGCSFDASRGTLRVFKGNKKMLWGKKTRGLYRLEGSVQTGGATIRHGSSGISKENGQGKQPLHRGTENKRRVQDVRREVQRKETKLILRICTAKGTVTPKRVSFALDLISGGVLSNSAHKGGEIEP
ncbi:pectin lyase-like superfamily protein [Actinidia rufa]|uniref:Pectin lyase-like superfamily protein n=1 Tax=Actinidia rufa TaxID=165716 RepID=A0A7J0GPP9_9ERIC|nr:pectin lyase-like superfamily protein [Actinidia rufa]